MTRPFALRIRSTALAKLAPSGPRRAAASALIPPLSVSRVRSADSTLSGMEPDDWVISGFELGMFWSREEGRLPVGVCLARQGLRGDEGSPALNRSLTIIVLTPLTMVPADRWGRSRKCLISLEFFHRGVVSRHEPEQTRAFPARGFAVLCADGPWKRPSGRPEPHPRPVQSQPRWLRLARHAADAPHRGRAAGTVGCTADAARSQCRFAQASAGAGAPRPEPDEPKPGPELWPACRQRCEQLRLRLAEPQA